MRCWVVVMTGIAINISSDFKTNLAQLPEVEDVESIELKFKDTGEVCGQSLKAQHDEQRNAGLLLELRPIWTEILWSVLALW